MDARVLDVLRDGVVRRACGRRGVAGVRLPASGPGRRPPVESLKKRPRVVGYSRLNEMKDAGTAVLQTRGPISFAFRMDTETTTGCPAGRPPRPPDGGEFESGWRPSSPRHRDERGRTRTGYWTSAAKACGGFAWRGRLHGWRGVSRVVSGGGQWSCFELGRSKVRTPAAPARPSRFELRHGGWSTPNHLIRRRTCAYPPLDQYHLVGCPARAPRRGAAWPGSAGSVLHRPS